MAHYVAELIHASESEEGAQRRESQHRAFETIVQLWRHRADIPMTDRPLRATDNVMLALDRLSDASGRGWYFDLFRHEDGLDPVDTSGQPLLRATLGAEDAARQVTVAAVLLAAEQALDRDAPWLAMSDHLERSPIRSVVRRLRLVRQQAQPGADSEIASINEESPINPDDEGSAYAQHRTELITTIDGAIDRLNTMRGLLAAQGAEPCP